MAVQIYESYLGEIQSKLSTGNATEHTHRLALQRLLESVGEVECFGQTIWFVIELVVSK